MIINNRFNRILAAVAVMGALCAASARAEDVEQAITILKVKGNARYSDDAMKTWHKCRGGDQIKPGSVIQTAQDGTLDLMMGEKAFIPTTPVASASTTSYNADKSGPKANVVHLYPSTVLVVDKLLLQRTQAGDVSETQLDLRAGKILGNVKKLSGGSRYEIKIPNGVAGIRGTTYLIGANGEVYVLIGSVVISYVDSQGNIQTTTVTAGNGWRPPENGNPGTIVPLGPGQLQHLRQEAGDLPTPPTTYQPGGPGHLGPVIRISPN